MHRARQAAVTELLQDGQGASDAQVARFWGEVQGRPLTPRGQSASLMEEASSRLLISQAHGLLGHGGQGPLETKIFLPMGSSEIEPCGFTGSNQRGTLISVKFKITLPSSLMKHNSSNQKVPWMCHSGSPQTGHSNATKGLPSAGGSERGGPASQTLGAPDATDRAPLQAVGGGGG